MTKPWAALSIGLSLGVLTDFIFNGVIVQTLFQSVFMESWIFIYVPVFLAVGSTLYTYLSCTRWSDHKKPVLISFAVGTLLGHLAFSHHQQIKIYTMNLDPDLHEILLRSDEWPQILFVQSVAVVREMEKSQLVTRIPIAVEVQRSYGCIQSAVINTVAGVDVRYDTAATWTWRIDNQVKTKIQDGPGLEDHILPWCIHVAPLKMLENPPGHRYWEKIPQSTPSGVKP